MYLHKKSDIVSGASARSTLERVRTDVQELAPAIIARVPDMEAGRKSRSIWWNN